MYVVKRNGEREALELDQITRRIRGLCFGLNEAFIDPAAVTVSVVRNITTGITTEQLDIETAKVAASMAVQHHDYELLAGRLLVDNMHKNVDESFVRVVERLYAHNLVSKSFYVDAIKCGDELEAIIDHKLDFDYRYFGYLTLENGYLLKIGDRVAERPQHMLMRVALAIHGADDVPSAIETYRMMSRKLFTHASPTMFAAGTLKQQLCSCFLLTVKRDSIEGIYSTLADCATISKYGGGIGVNVHKVRAHGSPIRSTNGTASGVEPMIRVFNNMVRHVDQGGKRKGALAVYIEPWHADIFKVLDLKRNMGAEDCKARDLMYALWVPDLFMKRVAERGMWSLMCPNECPGLDESYGDEFEKLYCDYEARGRYRRQIEALQLHRYIVETQVETGSPYMLYKDHCNRKSNQKNIGIIKCSNLCAEIVQYSDADETAVCNLASIAVNKCVVDGVFDFAQLRKTTGVVVRNLNKIIDINHYPLASAEASNRRHRPIGVGIQGLADAFVMLRLPFESDGARLLNRQIAETLYYAALEASCELAAKDGPYSSYANSPASRGILQYDMWKNAAPTDLWDWDELKRRISMYGLRNSLLIAYMPTATTAQILGNNESFEPFTNNVLLRRVLAGEFQVINRYLIDDLIRLGLYDERMRQTIVAYKGSVQNIDEIPDDIKALYKTVWEMKNKRLLDMAADRAAFIDQSQSLNIFVESPNYSIMSSVHDYGWRLGLKTGMYYLRTKPAADSQPVTVDPRLLREIEEKKRKRTIDYSSCSEIEEKKRKRTIDCSSCSA
ncbi:RR1 [Alphabaculovirus myunipunctae]|uniref:Ribonucleoside-diphosphate reductase n=1 Tax=Mythimna unipuncta nucleopolyhedrovirus TaxID=447897 RepID=A0A2K9VSH5_9ABAC|nr:RR1 [Mythimna unipuncta nucleopolyhedrovirus]AUV65415.1 RR1 [Mythimna unipuncta nucleopolyhedrovirus]